jgi:nucleoside 2-deoxyribosyltransferase
MPDFARQILITNEALWRVMTAFANVNRFNLDRIPDGTDYNGKPFFREDHPDTECEQCGHIPTYAFMPNDEAMAAPAVADDDDPFEDPGWLAFAEHLREEMDPGIKNSGMGMSFLDDREIDPRMACELGYLILYDKPIVIVVEPGVRVPDKIVKVADEIVEGGSMKDPAFKRRLSAAITRVQTKLGK